MINSDKSSVVPTYERQSCNPQIEKLLADAGTNKSNILEARIWLKDIKRDFAAMNGVFFKMMILNGSDKDSQSSNIYRMMLFCSVETDQD